MLHASETFDISQCHGCGLCALVCPSYQQGNSVLRTPHGMAKVKQSGGALDKEDVMACVLCGACAPLCPQPISMMQMLVDLRREVSGEPQEVEPLDERPHNAKGGIILIADESLLDNKAYLEKIRDLLGDGVRLAADHGSDISEAMRFGQGVSHARLHQFLGSLQAASQLIVSDGLIYQLIRDKLPQIPMQSLGQVLSSLEAVQRQLQPDDFYVMDSTSYHANYDEAVLHYDRLSRRQGCQLSRDLHRLAIAVGAGSVSGFDQARQVQWLLDGRDVKRIVVESVSDAQHLSQHCSQPVVHIVELLP